MSGTHNKQATLPEFLVEDTIDRMPVGQVAYMLPWGMWVDIDKNCWLHPKYTVTDRPEGTSIMRIERREDGYHVWPRGEKYIPRSEPGYASPADTEYIPVAELHT